MSKSLEIEFDGLYGKYQITSEDKLEVRKYRLSVLFCSISFLLGLNQWLLFGPSYVWIWLVSMSIFLGLALKWIHIYIQFLHRAIQALWAVGSIGILILIFKSSPGEILANISLNPIQILLIGPFFAALTGLGFKEFFCFGRIEAIGLTLILPISLGSYLFGILNKEIVMILLYFSSILLFILSLRKFGMDASSDIGDKSVFEHLKSQRNQTRVV